MNRNPLQFYESGRCARLMPDPILRQPREVVFCVLVRTACGLFDGAERRRGRLLTREGDRVHFRISDVFLPRPEDLIIASSAEEEVEGTIVGFSDSGSEPRAFAVVDVVQSQNVVVPTAKLRIVSSSGPDEG